MRELIRTNDIVLLSLVRALLGEAGIAHFVADEAMSALEGSIGILPRRVLVPAVQLDAARQLLADAGVAAETR